MDVLTEPIVIVIPTVVPTAPRTATAMVVPHPPTTGTSGVHVKMVQFSLLGEPAAVITGVTVTTTGTVSFGFTLAEPVGVVDNGDG